MSLSLSQSLSLLSLSLSPGAVPPLGSFPAHPPPSQKLWSAQRAPGRCLVSLRISFSRGFPRFSLCSPRINPSQPFRAAEGGREAEGCLFQAGSGSLSHFHGNAEGRGARWNPLIRILYCGSTHGFLRWENPTENSSAPASFRPGNPKLGSSRGPGACPPKPA